MGSANDLMGSGKHPFALQLSFQIFSLSGAPSEQGTLAYQWAAAHEHSLEVTSPGLGTLHALNLDAAQSDVQAREVFLLSKLLKDVLDPGINFVHGLQKAAPMEREIGKSILSCFQVGPSSANSSFQQTAVCTDKDSNVRLMNFPDIVVVRNAPANFAGTPADLDVEINIGGRPAVRGHIESLKGLAPAAVDKLQQQAEEREATAAKQSESATGSSKPEVLAGHRLKGADPVYPVIARQSHISGTVLLTVQITPAGTIGHMVPIASPDPMLTQAAEDAVKQWTYTPYLLDGKPTTVDSDITVHFNMQSTSFVH